MCIDIYYERYYKFISHKKESNEIKNLFNFIFAGALKVHQLFAHQSQQYRGKKIQTMCKPSAKITKPKFKNTNPKENSITYLSKYHNVSLIVGNGHICLECNSDFEETAHIT